MYEVLEMDKKMYEMLLEFEEINSAIDKYLDDIESDNDEELGPRKRNQIIDHQKSSLTANANNMHNNSIQPGTLNTEIVIFP